MCGWGEGRRGVPDRDREPAVGGTLGGRVRGDGVLGEKGCMGVEG